MTYREVPKVGDRFRFPLAEKILSQPEPKESSWLQKARRRARPTHDFEVVDSDDPDALDTETEGVPGPGGEESSDDARPPIVNPEPESTDQSDPDRRLKGIWDLWV